MIKKIIKNIFKIYYKNKKDLHISRIANVSFDSLKICGDGCRILGSVSVSSKVEIGKYTSINGPGTRIAAKVNKIQIGNFCSIASNVIVQEYYHKFDRITSYFINRNIFGADILEDIYSKGDIVIEDDVWIGSNTVILSGVKVGRGSVIGAGSVVTKDIPRYSIVCGNPARIIKNRFSRETTLLLEKLRWWEWSPMELKRNKHIFNMGEEELLRLDFFCDGQKGTSTF